jgi:hypothetical protein
MDDNVIRFPLLQAVLKDRSFHDEIAPVIELAAVREDRLRQQEMARINSEVRELLQEHRRIRLGGRPRNPDGPGTAVGL